MDRAIALEKLGLAGEDWGPCAGAEFTHAEFAAKWRGGVPCPDETALQAAFEAAQGEAPAEAPSLAEQIIANPAELAKLKTALGIK